MASRKIYYNPGSTSELVIRFGKMGVLHVEISKGRSIVSGTVNLPYEDAKEIIEELYSNLKEYEKSQEAHKQASKV